MAKVITDEQSDIYVANGGVICPHCGSSELECVGSLEADGASAWQSVSCECGESWTDIYTLACAE